MGIFGISREQMEQTASVFTLEEIRQQPATWKKTVEQVLGLRPALEAFLHKVLGQQDFDIVLTGAGTSEFVGNSLFQALASRYSYKIKSVATTDIVPSPEHFLSREKATLLVSFGRSGNSPESIGAVEEVEVVCKNLYHLFITCNPEGALARMGRERENCFSINLTPETHDRSFAMTSSFSNMYLACYMALSLDMAQDIAAAMDRVCAGVEKLLEEDFALAARLVEEFAFDRIIYLGNLALKGVAQESALKMLELSAGKVATMYDSPLGFRHGPKSVIQPGALTVVYLSDDAYRRGYEMDLLREMAPQRKGNRIVAVCNRPAPELEGLADYVLQVDLGQEMDNIYLGLAFVPFAQMLAALKSLALGISPDNPCPTGEVNRVVQGVTLYPYTLA